MAILEKMMNDENEWSENEEMMKWDMSWEMIISLIVTLREKEKLLAYDIKLTVYLGSERF